MPDKFKAIVINNTNENFSREIKELTASDLKDGNVLVKVDFSSFRPYRPALRHAPKLAQTMQNQLFILS